MEEIYQQFTEKVGTTDLSERSLKGILETVYSADMDETQTTAAIEKATTLAKTMQGQLNKTIADKAKDFEKKIKELESKAKPDDVDEPDKATGSKEITEIKTELNKLKKELETEQEEKAVTKKRKEVIAAAKKLGVKEEDFCVEAVNLMSLSAESDVDGVAGKILTLYNKMVVSSVENPKRPKAARQNGGDFKEWREKFKQVAPKE